MVLGCGEIPRCYRIPSSERLEGEIDKENTRLSKELEKLDVKIEKLDKEIGEKLNGRAQ